jgi:hypothetical protein
VHVNTKMVPVETVPRMGGRGINENWKERIQV